MDWHVWTIVQNRYSKVIEFLNDLDGVEDFLYPTVSKEYSTKSGTKLKQVPLYSNYIFVKYNHSNEFVLSLQKCPWIKTYVGICSKDEIKEIKSLSKRKYEDIVPTSKVIIGHTYKLIATPFKGMTCTVVDVEDDKLSVSLMIFGAERIIKCSVDDIDLER